MQVSAKQQKVIAHLKIYTELEVLYINGEFNCVANQMGTWRDTPKAERFISKATFEALLNKGLITLAREEQKTSTAVIKSYVLTNEVR